MRVITTYTAIAALAAVLVATAAQAAPQAPAYPQAPASPKAPAVAPMTPPAMASGPAPAATGVALAVPDRATLEALDIHPAATPSRRWPGWTPPRVVLLGARDAAQLPGLRAALPQAEFVVAADAAAALAAAPRVDVAIGECSPAFVAAAPRLRWILTLGAGVDQCTGLAAVREGRVHLTAMQGTNADAVADHALALLLALTRNIGPNRDSQARGEWRRVAAELGAMQSLRGRTLLVVGLGHIGRAIARRAAAFGVRVVATRGRGAAGGRPEFVAEVGGPADLLRLAAGADFAVNVAPLTPATTGLFDAKFFGALPAGALFVNLGRGASVVQPELIAALESGRLGGAALDVTDPEPLPPDHPLWRAPRVLITPHVAGADRDNNSLKWALAQENLRRYAAGRPLYGVVDGARGY